MTDNSLIQDFITETGEHLEEVERNVLHLEQRPDDVAVLNDIFRSIHTIKGSSEYLGMERIAELSHKLESLLDLLRRGERTVNAGIIDLLMGCNDRIGVLVKELEQHQAERSSIDDLVARLEGGAGQAEPDADESGQEPGDGDGYMDDEYDEELFGIFVEQLKDGLTGLAQDAGQLHRAGADPTTVLESCAGRLNTLRSSANYMGYDDLKGIYDQWSQAVEQAIEGQKTGQETDLGKFIQETMQANLDRVKALFPKISFPSVEPAPQELDMAGEFEESDFLEPEPEPDVDQGLLADFITETGEHLEEVERNVLLLEQRPDDAAVLNDIFRSIHTIKGSSEYLGMERIAELSHKLESLLDLLRRGERTVNAGIIDLLMGCNDRIGVLVKELEQHQAERSSIDDLMAPLEKSLLPEEQPEGQSEEQPEEKDAEHTGDQVKEPAPAVATAIASEDVSEVVYGEEYDKDLFGIFMGQFKQGLQVLTDEADRFREAEQMYDVLARCTQQIEILKSSANYMEYDELRDIYEKWLQQIVDMRRQLSTGGINDTEMAIQEVILTNIHRVKQFFPHLETDAAHTVTDGDSSDDSPLVVETEETAGPVPSEDITGGDNDLAAAIAEQFKDLGSGLESISLDALKNDEQLAALDKLPATDEDTALLDKLASAFDAHLGTSLEKVERPFPEDIENHLLSGLNVEETATPSPSPEPVPADFSPSDNLSSVGDIETMLFSGPEQRVQPIEPEKAAPFVPLPDKGEGGAALEPVADAPEPASKRHGFGRRQSDKVIDRGQKQSIRVDAAKIDALMNQVGELVVSRSGFSQLFSDMRELQLVLKQSHGLDSRYMQQIKDITNRIQEATISLSRVTSELQENVMKVRMLPIAQLFSRYPRLVHDLVRNTEKKVDLEILGEETELDRMVIEKLADPLIHIIRNAVDHGIEDVATRRQKSKPETGVLRIEAYHEANFVVIEISDDGKGIDVQLVKKCALEKGFASIAEIEKMNDQQIMSFIMQPGFSTAMEVTHTSGRGVGMDVVKESIEKLNGSIEIENTVGAGACFRIKIPLTLAIIPALLVRLADEIFTIPLSTVEETIRINKEEVGTIEGVEVFHLRDATIPLIRLKRVFNMDGADENRQELFVVVVNTGVKQVGLVVDELRVQQEVVIKPLEDYLQEKSGFSGATLLGDGSISLILDVVELVELSLDRHGSAPRVAVM
jgi:two-component system, chemotaxis family, sensor kinase CheA